MKKTIRSALLVGLAAAFVGCGSSGSSAPADARDFCQQAIELEIAKAEYCGGDYYPDFAVAALIDCNSFADAQDAGRVAFDQGQASACLAALDDMSCADYTTVDLGSFAGLPDACRAAMAPQVATGEPCFSQLGYECAGYCDMGENACLAGGVCRDYLGEGGDCSTGQRCAIGLRCDGSVCAVSSAPAIVGEGADCDVPNAVCDDPYYCCQDETQCTIGTCVPKKPAGELCIEREECRLGLRCISTGGPPTCTAPLAVGAECVGGDCARGLYCNDQGVCAESPRLGDSCAEPASGDQIWCVDSWCNYSAEEPTCQPFGEPGDVCRYEAEEDFFLSCGPGYYCLPLAEGYGVCGRLYCTPFL